MGTRGEEGGRSGGLWLRGEGGGLWARREGGVGVGEEEGDEMWDRENLSEFIAPMKNLICT